MEGWYDITLPFGCAENNSQKIFALSSVFPK
jgi:hypothetical protein